MKILFIHILSVLLALQSPSNGSDRFLDAVALYSEGSYAEAGALFRELAGEDSENDAVFYYLGMCDFHDGELDEAELFMREAVGKDSTNFWYREGLSQILIAREDYKSAIEGYESLLRDFPKKTDIYYSLLSLYARVGRMDDVLSTIDAIEEIAGKDDRLTLARYDMLIRQGRPDEAYAALEDFNSDFASAEVLSVMADHQLAQDHDSLALSLYDEALRTDASYAPALLGKAEYFRIRNRYEDYFDCLNRFITQRDIPSEMKAQYLSRLFRAMDGRVISEYRGRFESLLAVAVDMYPDDLLMRANSVQFSAVMGDWQRVLEICEDAYSRFPSETGFLNYRSIAYYNMADYDSFIKENERIIRSAPADSAAVLEAWSGIGDMQYRLGDPKKAFKAYESALRINPSYAPVLNNYAYYLSLERKKLKKALSMSKTTIDAEPDNPTYLDTYGWILYLLRRPSEAKPVFKHAMIYGGKESVETLFHYSLVLDALGETDLAKVYRSLAENKKKQQ